MATLANVAGVELAGDDFVLYCTMEGVLLLFSRAETCKL